MNNKPIQTKMLRSLIDAYIDYEGSIENVLWKGSQMDVLSIRARINPCSDENRKFLSREIAPLIDDIMLTAFEKGYVAGFHRG